ncbi:hypothetical protein ACH54D_20620 [Atlantibacter hermannii]|uniref:hypothetical protein n=1 Tax=Atlantibacter hermannii TaxID=565 RepID=UPI0032554CAF
MKKLAIIAAVLALAGCKSAADRMYECEAHGISRDACYMAEQNRQSGMNAAAQKQAYENAAAAVNTDSDSGSHHHGHKHHHDED